MPKLFLCALTASLFSAAPTSSDTTNYLIFSQDEPRPESSWSCESYLPGEDKPYRANIVCKHIEGSEILFSPMIAYVDDR